MAERVAKDFQDGTFWTPDPVIGYKSFSVIKRGRFNRVKTWANFLPEEYDLGVRYKAHCHKGGFCPYKKTEQHSQYPVPHLVLQPGTILASSQEYLGNCGFHAYKTLDSLWRDQVLENFGFTSSFGASTSAEIDWTERKIKTAIRLVRFIDGLRFYKVALEGRIIEHEFGYRASHQTILERIPFNKVVKEITSGKDR